MRFFGTCASRKIHSLLRSDGTVPSCHCKFYPYILTAAVASKKKKWWYPKELFNECTSGIPICKLYLIKSIYSIMHGNYVANCVLPRAEETGIYLCALKLGALPFNYNI